MAGRQRLLLDLVGAIWKDDKDGSLDDRKPEPKSSQPDRKDISRRRAQKRATPPRFPSIYIALAHKSRRF